MKKLMSFLIFSLSLSFIFSQEKGESLFINYTQQIDMDIEEVLKNIPSQYRAQAEPILREELKNGITNNYELKTNGKVSVYSIEEKLNNAQSTGGMIAQQMAQADKEPLYKYLNENKYKKLIDFPGIDRILIYDSLPDYQWKVLRETEKIAGYETRKATGFLNDSVSVEAWFAPKIPINDGPAQVAGLPGLILKASFKMNGADVTITANQIKVRDEDIKIKEPKANRVMRQKEFEEEMKHWTEKMKKMHGTGVDKD